MTALGMSVESWSRLAPDQQFNMLFGLLRKGVSPILWRRAYNLAEHLGPKFVRQFEAKVAAESGAKMRSDLRDFCRRVIATRNGRGRAQFSAEYIARRLEITPLNQELLVYQYADLWGVETGNALSFLSFLHQGGFAERWQTPSPKGGGPTFVYRITSG